MHIKLLSLVIGFSFFTLNVYSEIPLSEFATIAERTSLSGSSRLVIQGNHPAAVPGLPISDFDRLCIGSRFPLPSFTHLSFYMKGSYYNENYIVRQELRLSLEAAGIPVNPGIEDLIPLNSDPLTLNMLRIILDPAQRKVAKILTYNQIMKEVRNRIYLRIGGLPRFNFTYDTCYYPKFIAVVDINRAVTPRCTLLKSCLQLAANTPTIVTPETEGHDQCVVSIIRCLAPSAIIKQYSIEGNTHALSQTLNVIALDPSILLINLSLGPSEEDANFPLNFLVGESMIKALKNGKVIVISSGNFGVRMNDNPYGRDLLKLAKNVNESLSFPGKLVIVGASESSNGREIVSHQYNHADDAHIIYAPGVTVPSLDVRNQLEFCDGTSCSSPIVTALLFNVATHFLEGNCTRAVDVLKRTTSRGVEQEGGGVVNASVAYDQAYIESTAH
ncbi:MAG: hypothetical protein A2007_00280 [Verrucomicrobia bacterium GWC2_42_7]|nr:MAG: hypothetical protein A2007_00280 [Verrucomicrobia bacterium GWC2_42_7]